MARFLESRYTPILISTILFVSIIIPVYNTQDFLASTIESALRQSYRSKEVIVVDDGSTDNSHIIAKAYEKDGVILIKQANAGAAAARNTGLAHAKGDLIQFLDAGDLLSDDKIEKQVRSLKNNPYKLAVCNYLQFCSESELNTLLFPDQSRFIFTTDQSVDFLVNLWGGNGEANFIQTNCWLVPRVLINKAGLWRPVRYCQDDDGEFFARVILASDGIVYVPGVYNYFRVGVGANKLSGNTKSEYLKNALLTINLKHEYLLQKGGHPKLNAAMAKQYLDFAVYNYPAQKQLSALAMRRYRKLNEKAELPMLGGKFVEGLKNLVGWRGVRFLLHHLRERGN